MARKKLLQEKFQARGNAILFLFKSRFVDSADALSNIKTQTAPSHGSYWCACTNVDVFVAELSLSVFTKSIIHALVDGRGDNDLSCLTDIAWVSVLDGKVRVGRAMWESRTRSWFDSQLARASRDMLDLGLPPLSPNDPTTFFSANGHVHERLFTYHDVLSFLNCRYKKRKCLDNLIETTQAGGTSFWASTSPQLESLTWVVNTKAVCIATILLGQLRFLIRSGCQEGEDGEGTSGLRSMDDLLAKCPALICWSCPEDARVKLGWRDLVRHRITRYSSGEFETLAEWHCR